MKENILRILLSLFIVFTFFEVFRNSSSDYFVKIADGLSQFSLKSDLPADEVSRLVMSEADSAGFDILIEDYEMINVIQCFIRRITQMISSRLKPLREALDWIRMKASRTVYMAIVINNTGCLLHQISRLYFSLLKNSAKEKKTFMTLSCVVRIQIRTLYLHHSNSLVLR